MRFGIFSDVHSNIEALTTVIAEYEKLDEPIDQYFCLGDVVGYGANPNECCDIVKDIAEFTILGNHDAAVCGRMNYAFYYDAARNALEGALTYAAQQSDGVRWGALGGALLLLCCCCCACVRRCTRCCCRRRARGDASSASAARNCWPNESYFLGPMPFTSSMAERVDGRSRASSSSVASENTT